MFITDLTVLAEIPNKSPDTLAVVSVVIELLSVIVSSILTGVIIYQTNKINKSANEQNKQIAEKQLDFEKRNANENRESHELELKINLFDKRYAIYDKLSEYTNVVDMAIKASKAPFPDGSHITSKEIIIDCINKTDRRNALKKELHDLNLKIDKAGTKVKQEELDSKRQNTINEIQIDSLVFLNKDHACLKLSEFCYPNDISSAIISFSDILFDWLSPVTKVTEDRVVEELHDFNENNILNKMKLLLNLSYNDSINAND